MVMIITEKIKLFFSIFGNPSDLGEASRYQARAW